MQYGEKITRLEDHIRDGSCFEGRYKDINETEAWDFENDVVQGSITLYTSWKELDTETLTGHFGPLGGNADSYSGLA
ncbi:MAG: InlB B-repeat-containing protein [Faecousia sp.]